MKTISASAPGKLMIFGEHAVVYGYPCIVTAVDQRVHVTIHETANNYFHVQAPDLNTPQYKKLRTQLGSQEIPKAVSFLEMCYKRFLDKFPQKFGVHVVTKSDFSATFGFGSSSAVTVAFAKALSSLYNIPFTNQELFDLCYQAVLDVQGVGSGFDIAAAIWGGTLYYVKPAKIIEVLTMDPLPLIVGYTGIKADTATIVREVEKKRNMNKKNIEHIFFEIENLTNSAKHAIQAKNWKYVGELMDQNEKYLENLEVQSKELDEMVALAKTHGALGAKLSGAGKGDCMIALSDQVHANTITDSLKKIHGGTLTVQTSAEGARLE